MASLMDKLRTFTLSNLHSLLDAAIDLNSVEAVKQRVRDIEDQHRNLLQALAGAKGNRSAVQSQTTAIKARIVELGENIETLLGDDDPSNDHYADPFAEQMGDAESELETTQDEFEAANAEVAALERAEGQLKSKVSQLHTRLRELASLERQARAKQGAAGALNAATEALGSGPDASVDSIERRLRAEAGTADAALGQAMEGLNGAGGAEAALRSSKAASRVAKIREDMERKKAAAAAAG